MDIKHQRILKFVQGTVSVCLVVILLFSVGIDSLGSVIRQIRIVWLPVILATVLFPMFLGAFNIWILLNSQAKITFNKFFQAYIHAYATGLIIPGQIGDVSLALFLRSNKISVYHSGVAYLIDKTISLFIGVSLGLVGLHHYFSGNYISLNVSNSIGIIFVFSIILGIIGFAILKKFLFSRTSLLRTFWGRFVWYIKRVYSSFRVYFSYWHLIVLNALLSLLKWCIVIASFILAFAAVGVKVQILDGALVPIMASLVGYLPISIGGVGPVEITAGYIFGLINIKLSSVIAVYAILRTLQFLLTGISVLVVKLIFNKKFSEIDAIG